MKAPIAITVEHPGWRKITRLRGRTKAAILACETEMMVEINPLAELSLLLSGDERIRELNAVWRGLDKPTNVLSFPQKSSTSNNMLGDIVISFDTIKREAGLEDKVLTDHYTHLLVHGYLHLLGYDHEIDAEARVMENYESRILARLGLPDPYRGLATDIEIS